MLFNPLAFDWHDGGALFGNGVLLAAAVLWASSILHIRSHRWQAPPFYLIPWEMALATAVLGTLALLVEGWRPIEWTPTLVALLLYSALPGTVIVPESCRLAPLLTVTPVPARPTWCRARASPWQCRQDSRRI